MGHCLFMRKGETHTAPISGILASDLAVGSSVYLMENGVATEYLVVNQGKPSGSSLYDDSCDGMWLLRKDCFEDRNWNDSDGNGLYKDSAIHSYLNSTFLDLFDTNIQEIIKQVKIPYVNVVNGTMYSTVASGSNGLSTKVFLLSGYEVGFTNSIDANFQVDGSCLTYFTENSDSKRIAYMNGTETKWFTRSPYSGSTGVFIVKSDGSYWYAKTNSLNSVRPSIILPSNALFDKTTLILKGVA